MVLIRHTKDTAARLKKPVSNKSIMRLMISIGGVMFLFGLTWLFAILTFSVDGLRETFQILFTIFNSFQGFFIFLFFCVLNKEALESWKELLSCGKYKSKLLHPTKAAKFNSTAMANKVIHSKIGTAGLTVPSREKYTTGSSIFDSESATLVRESFHERAPPEAANLEVDQGTDLTIGNPAVEEKGLIEGATELTEHTTIPEIIVEPTNSVDGGLQNGGAEERNKKKAVSLKACIKRYTTKKASKHQEEEIEVDCVSDNSIKKNVGEDDSSTQL